MSPVERQLTEWHPDRPEQDDAVEHAIYQAYRRLRYRLPGSSDLVPLTEVLDELELGVGRAQWDRVIGRLALDERVHVWAENDQKRLTEWHRFAAVVLGGSARHVIHFTDLYQSPAHRPPAAVVSTSAAAEQQPVAVATDRYGTPETERT